MEDFTDQIPEERWASYLEAFTAEHGGAPTTIEGLDREFGDEYEAGHIPLAFLLYDPRDDVVEIAVGGTSGSYPVVLRHFVRHPEQIWHRASGADRVFLVVDSSGTKTLVTVTPPAGLPA